MKIYFTWCKHNGLILSQSEWVLFKSIPVGILGIIESFRVGYIPPQIHNNMYKIIDTCSEAVVEWFFRNCKYDVKCDDLIYSFFEENEKICTLIWDQLPTNRYESIFNIVNISSPRYSCESDFKPKVVLDNVRFKDVRTYNLTNIKSFMVMFSRFDQSVFLDSNCEDFKHVLSLHIMDIIPTLQECDKSFIEYHADIIKADQSTMRAFTFEAIRWNRTELLDIIKSTYTDYTDYTDFKYYTDYTDYTEYICISSGTINADSIRYILRNYKKSRIHTPVGVLYNYIENGQIDCVKLIIEHEIYDKSLTHILAGCKYTAITYCQNHILNYLTKYVELTPIDLETAVRNGNRYVYNKLIPLYKATLVENVPYYAIHPNIDIDWYVPSSYEISVKILFDIAPACKIKQWLKILSSVAYEINESDILHYLQYRTYAFKDVYLLLRKTNKITINTIFVLIVRKKWKLIKWLYTIDKNIVSKVLSSQLYAVINQSIANIRQLAYYRWILHIFPNCIFYLKTCVPLALEHNNSNVVRWLCSLMPYRKTIVEVDMLLHAMGQGRGEMYSTCMTLLPDQIRKKDCDIYYLVDSKLYISLFDRLTPKTCKAWELTLAIYEQDVQLLEVMVKHTSVVTVIQHIIPLVVNILGCTAYVMFTILWHKLIELETPLRPDFINTAIEKGGYDNYLMIVDLFKEYKQHITPRSVQKCTCTYIKKFLTVKRESLSFKLPG